MADTTTASLATETGHFDEKMDMDPANSGKAIAEQPCRLQPSPSPSLQLQALPSEILLAIFTTLLNPLPRHARLRIRCTANCIRAHLSHPHARTNPDHTAFRGCVQCVAVVRAGGFYTISRFHTACQRLLRVCRRFRCLVETDFLYKELDLWEFLDGNRASGRLLERLLRTMRERPDLGATCWTLGAKNIQTVRGVDIGEIFGLCSGLRRLTMSEMYKDFRTVAAMVRHAPQVRDLHVYHGDGSANAGADGAVWIWTPRSAGFTGLTITFTRAHLLSTAAAVSKLVHLSRRMTTLRLHALYEPRIEMARDNEVDEIYTAAIHLHADALTHLTLEPMPGWPSLDLDRFNRLQTLDIWIRHLRDTPVATIANLPSLQHLTVDYAARAPWSSRPDADNPATFAEPAWITFDPVQYGLWLGDDAGGEQPLWRLEGLGHGVRPEDHECGTFAWLEAWLTDLATIGSMGLSLRRVKLMRVPERRFVHEFLGVETPPTDREGLVRKPNEAEMTTWRIRMGEWKDEVKEVGIALDWEFCRPREDEAEEEEESDAGEDQAGEGEAAGGNPEENWEELARMWG